MNAQRLLTVAAAAASLAFFSAASHATVISAVSNNPYGFNWNYVTGTADGTLTGSGSLTVSGFGTATLTVAVSLTNTSSLITDRLTSFGFGINPNAQSVGFSDVNDGGMIGASLDSIPSLATIEVCAYGGPNCSGGGSGGIAGGGGSDSFSILLTALTGTLWGSSVDIAPIGFKYQGAVTSYEFTTTTPPTPPTSVPEPATSALLFLGLGLFGLGRINRRGRAS